MLFFSLGVLAVDVPYWDDYGAIVRYMGMPLAERMEHLFDFHNEHRILIPRLVFEVFDLYPGRFPFFASIIMQSAKNSLKNCKTGGGPLIPCAFLLRRRP